MLLLRIVLFLIGVSLVWRVLLSIIQTFVLPRGVPDRITRVSFLAMRRLFDLRVKKMSAYADRDRVMALYSPVTLIVLEGVWFLLVLGAYVLMYWSIGVGSWKTAFHDSGSSLFTLGFAQPGGQLGTALAFSEAGLGLLIAALLIAYLPAMYTAWSRRETSVALLEVRAGSPPSALEMIVRFNRLERLGRLDELWPRWEEWFVDLEESHTSLAPLAFFRSHQPNRSWVTSAGTILDAAALVSSTLDVPRNPDRELCLRAGYLALREVAAFFRIQFDPDPNPTDSISITRDDFDYVYDQMEKEGVPLKPDRDKAWHQFAGWRVNYDTVLLALADLTMAPEAPWSTDRLPGHEHIKVKLRRG